jgi:hypothetical protein
LHCEKTREERRYRPRCAGAHFDLRAYHAYLSGETEDNELPDETLAASLAGLP